MALTRPTPFVVVVPFQGQQRRGSSGGSGGSNDDRETGGSSATARPPPPQLDVPRRPTAFPYVHVGQRPLRENASASALPSASGTPSADQNASRQLRRTSHRRPLKVDWSQSAWMALGQEPLSIQKIGWCNLTCPLPARDDGGAVPAGSQTTNTHTLPDQGYFFIDDAAMPQASNHPWGPTPLRKRIKVSRSKPLPKVYADINTAIAADEDYDSRIVKRVIMRAMGATEADLERADRIDCAERASTAGLSSRDGDTLTMRSSVSVMPLGTPRAFSRQLSLPASVHGDDDRRGGSDDDDEDDEEDDTSATISRQASTSRSVSAAAEGAGIGGNDDEAPADLFLNAEEEVSVEPAPRVIPKAEPISMDVPPPSAPSEQVNPTFYIDLDAYEDGEGGEEESKFSPAQPTVVEDIPVVAPTPSASQIAKNKRIPTTRGARLSAAAVRRLRQRPKREVRERQHDDEDDDGGSSSDGETGDDAAHNGRRRSGRPTHSNGSSRMDVQPLKFDLSGWGKPTQRLSRGHRDRADASEDDDVQMVEANEVEAERERRRRLKGKGKAKETETSASPRAAAAASRTRFVIPPMDTSDEEEGDGEDEEQNQSRAGTTGQPRPQLSPPRSGRQALLSHSWMSRSQTAATGPNGGQGRASGSSALSRPRANLDVALDDWHSRHSGGDGNGGESDDNGHGRVRFLDTGSSRQTMGIPSTNSNSNSNSKNDKAHSSNSKSNDKQHNPHSSKKRQQDATDKADRERNARAKRRASAAATAPVGQSQDDAISVDSD